MRRVALLLLFLALVTTEARAGLQVPIPLADDARAKVTVGCCFASLPPKGYAPIDVTINNFSGSTQEWRFHFSGIEYMGTNGVNVSSDARVSVENQATRTIPLLVPVSAPDGMEGSMLRVTVEGYGTEGGSAQIIGGNTNTGQPGTRYVAISNRLGTALWSMLDSKLHAQTRHLNGSLFEPAELPSDWRGLSGVHTMWLGEGEVDQLSPAQRAALRTWVRMGGSLKFCGASAVPADFQPAGFGKVETPSAILNADGLAKTIAGLGPPMGERLLDSMPSGRGAGLDAVAPNVPGLIAFMGLFAVVVGPVNIFLLAGSKRRQRLFWTTPAISVAASAGLIAFILLQDGVGGKGVRGAFVYVLPREHSEIVLQQQSSRTGLLLSSGFQTRDPVVMEQLPPEQGTTGRTRSLENDGTGFRGEWFVSRSLQTQRIESEVSTRGEITLLNAQEARDQGPAPVILSSFAVPFDKLVYTDALGHQWYGKDVEAGRKQTLEPADTQDIFPHEQTPLFREPGGFAASSADSAALVETLPAIRWKDEPVIYMGRVTIP